MKKKRGVVCPECGGANLIEDPSRGELYCSNCGYVVQESIIDTSQEWRAFDTEQMSRRARAGAPLTFSVDYDEPIVIKEGNEIKLVKIGEFVDRIMRKNKTKKEGNVEIASVEKNKFYAVSFDENYNLDFHPITEVTRHPVDEIYEIEVEGGRIVKATGSHSLFTVKDNKVVEKEVEKIKRGDFVVAPKWLPSENKLKIDLLSEFIKISHRHKNLYLRDIFDDNIFEMLRRIGVDKNKIKTWKRRSIIPLYVLANIQDLHQKLNGESMGLQYSRLRLPLQLEITRDLCKLLGYYVADGDCSSYNITFCFGSHEESYVNEVKQLMRSIFGIDAYVDRSLEYATRVSVNSKLVSILFSEVFGAGSNAKEKRIPSFIFSSPAEMKLSFLHGYINGDGHVWQRKDTQVGATTASKDLADDLLMLYLQLGIHANYWKAKIPSHTIKKTGQVVSESMAHMVRVTNPDLAVKFGFVDEMPKRKRKEAIEELIPAPFKYRKEWKCRKRIRIGRKLAVKIAKKYGDEDLLKLAQAPFIFLRVKSIRKVKPSKKYAYDLTVPGCWNFVGKLLWKDTKHDKGLTTEIGKGVGELYRVTPKKRAQYYRLAKWQKRLIRSKDRNLSFALSELQRIVSFLGLPRSIHERIAKYYEEAVNKGLVRGRSIESVIAALVYAVSRQFNSPRTLEEIAEASGIEKREIGRAYRYVSRELGIKILPADPASFVPRFTSILGLSDRVQAKAIEILRKARKLDATSGKGPTGVAAAAIYIACVLVGEKRTQREVADICNITEVTIRNRYKEIVEKLGIEEEVEKKAKEE